MTVPFLAIGAFAVAVGFFVEHCIAADDRKATRSEKWREMHQKSRERNERKNKEKWLSSSSSLSSSFMFWWLRDWEKWEELHNGSVAREEAHDSKKRTGPPVTSHVMTPSEGLGPSGHSWLPIGARLSGDPPTRCLQVKKENTKSVLFVKNNGGERN